MNESKRLALLRILQILENYSNQDHPLLQEDIMKYLDKDYGIEIERKAVGRNLQLLKEAGYDIKTIFRKGVYLEDRLFDDSELMLLMNEVSFSKNISEEKTKQLVDKLKKLGGNSFTKSMPAVYVGQKVYRWHSDDIFKAIKIINKAIKDEHKLEFVNNKYGIDKRLHSIKKEVVSPYQIISTNDNYYLLCNRDGYDNIINFRLDMLTDIKEFNEPRRDVRDTKEKGIYLHGYITSHPYMVDRESEVIGVILRVDRNAIISVVDSFGDNFNLSNATNYTVDISIRANKSDILRWALYNASNVEIIEPQSLRNELEDIAEEMSAKYIRNDMDKYRDMIEEAKSSGELDIYRMKVQDLIKKEDLTNIEKISLMATDISDITFMAKNRNISELHIVDCPMKDLSFLSGSKTIKEIDLRSTEITSIEFLRGMDLEDLVLGDNANLDDYEALYNMKGLANLIADSYTMEKIDKDRLRTVYSAIKINIDDNMVVSWDMVYRNRLQGFIYPYNVLEAVFNDDMDVNYRLDKAAEDELKLLINSIFNEKLTEEMRKVAVEHYQKELPFSKVMTSLGLTKTVVISFDASIVRILRHPSNSIKLWKYMPKKKDPDLNDIEF